MNNRYFSCCLFAQRIALLLVVGLNSCQRASYQFQPVTGATAAPTEAAAAIGAAVAPATPRWVPAGAAKPAAKWSASPRGYRKSAPRTTSQATLFRPAQQVVQMLRTAGAEHISIAGPAKIMPQLTPEQPRSKGVAVLLAGLLGMFGAHLFYLGNARRASTYLITTLVCIGLVLIAIPVANSAAFGSGIGGAFVGIFLLLLGFGGIAFTYLKALVDGVRILTDSLPY